MLSLRLLLSYNDPPDGFPLIYYCSGLTGCNSRLAKPIRWRTFQALTQWLDARRFRKRKYLYLAPLLYTRPPR